MRIEQAVYGTFTFTEGFALVSASEGLEPEARQALTQVCKSWGEVRSSGFRSALYHVPVALGAERDPGKILHLVGKVVRQGTDAGGVRTAWYQQVLVIGHDDYLDAGADCFAWQEAGLFKDRWFESDRCVPVEMEKDLLPPFDCGPEPEPRLALSGEVARSLADGCGVRFCAAEPAPEIGRLFRHILHLLPVEFRARISLATFCFRPAIDYDLWCLYDADCPWSPAAPIRQVEVRNSAQSALGRGSFDSAALAAAVDAALERCRSGRLDGRTP